MVAKATTGIECRKDVDVGSESFPRLFLLCCARHAGLK
jgi:hypothetical protein